MSVFLGSYFAVRKPNDTFGLKFGYAASSTVLASLAELPFDSTKRAMAGTVRGALFTTGLRVPLYAFMLVAYDQLWLSLPKRIAQSSSAGEETAS